MNKKKFIITQTEAVANKMIAQGFRLVSHIGNSWTFENSCPKNFSFGDEDKKLIAYSNILSV